MSTRRAGVLGAVLAAAVAFVYVVMFRAYGLNIEDEGTLIFQITRVADGQLPYVDFSTGYTPVFFALAARLWRATGALPTFRVLIGAVHALTAGALALLVARIARPLIAVLAALLYVAFIPVFPGEFCAFNIPYPAWFATLGWTLTALAMMAFVDARRRLWLVAAGCAAGVMLGIKPNAGVFAIAAATSVLLLVEDDPRANRSVGATGLWIALWFGLVAGGWVALGGRPGIVDAAVYLVPVALAMAAFVLVDGARIGRATLVADVIALLAPFVAVSAPWVVFFWARLGTARFGREVLLIGSGAAELYYRPYPAIEGWALLLTALLLAVAMGGAVVARAPRVLPIVGAVAAIALALSVAAVMRRGLMPERWTWSIIWQLENAAFALTPATHAVGVLWLWRRGVRREHVQPAVILLFALYMYLQLYPRADFPHLIGAAPLTLVFAGFLLDRTLCWWETGISSAGWGRARFLVTCAAALLLSGAIGLRVTPSLAALTLHPREVLPFTIARIGVEREHADDLRHLGAAATILGEVLNARVAAPPPMGDRRAPDAASPSSVGFPALDLALVLVGARNPTAHDYFYPGRPDHLDEAEIVDRLAVAPPAALAAVNRHFTFFDGAPAYYFLLRHFVSERYDLRVREGRYDVLALRDGIAGEHAPATTTGSAREAARAEVRSSHQSELLAQATADDASTRAAGLEDLMSLLERNPERGLERYVETARLDVRRQVLLLRTIRDAREARAASYLFQAVGSGEERLVREALDAMERTRAELIARRHLWSGPEEPQVWPAREDLEVAIRSTLADERAPPQAAAFAAELAGILRESGSIPALRARLQAAEYGAPATTASAAGALAILAPQGLACRLTALLGRRDPEVVELLPSILVGLGEGVEPARSEARACLTAVLGVPSSGRVLAIWIVAALGDPAFVGPLRAALAAPESEVRSAAAWTLGELPADEETDALLARIARSDVDANPRRFARSAIAKHDGSMARALARRAS